MVRQREMLGLGHAILTGEPLIGDQPFGVVLSDDLCLNKGGPGVLAQMAVLYEEHQCSIVAVQEVPREEVDKYGVVAGAVRSKKTLHAHCGTSCAQYQTYSCVGCSLPKMRCSAS